MFEMICGERNEGKTHLAINRVISDYKDNKKRVVYFSDKKEAEDFHNILNWYEIDFLQSTVRYPYYPITFFTTNNLQQIFDIICDMRASLCGPEVVCIDLHLKPKDLKEIERIEHIFKDILFIVTLNTQTFYDAIHKIEIEDKK